MCVCVREREVRFMPVPPPPVSSEEIRWLVEGEVRRGELQVDQLADLRGAAVLCTDEA